MRVDKSRWRVTRPRRPESGQIWANTGRPSSETGAGAAAPQGDDKTRQEGPTPTTAAPSWPRGQPRLSQKPGPPVPTHPAPAGSGAPRTQPRQLLHGRPGQLRAHLRQRAAGSGPLGTILPAAPGAVSGFAGPTLGPEASPAHTAPTQISRGPVAVVSG